MSIALLKNLQSISTKIGASPDFLLFLIFFQYSNVVGIVQQILVLFKARIEVRVNYPCEKVFICDTYQVGKYASWISLSLFSRSAIFSAT